MPSQESQNIPPLSNQSPEHVLRSELPKERLKDVFADHARIVMEHRQGAGREKFFRVEDNWHEFTQGMSSPEKWYALRSRVENGYPSAAYFSKQADIQQRLAEQLIADGKITLEAIKEKRRQYGSRREALGLSCPEGLAAAYDLLQREGSEVFYPDPLLDALVKLDIVAYEPETETYYFFQIKTEDSLDGEPCVMYTPDEVEQKIYKNGTLFAESGGYGRAEDARKLIRDLKTLSRFSEECGKTYRESFVPLFLALPSLHSPAHARYCDQKTGLPKRDFPAIKLPESHGKK